MAGKFIGIDDVSFELIPKQPENPVYTGKKKKRKNTQANGYAMPPGGGPEGETCKTCVHCIQVEYHDKNYYKCGEVRDRWTHGTGSDIRLRSPACLKWKADNDADTDSQ